MGVTAAVANQWLPGVVVVDTPGVGGVVSAHGDLARRAAAGRPTLCSS